MINIVLWLVFGALVGWLASIVMRTNAQQGLLLNILVGVLGAFLGGLIFNLLGFDTTTNITNNVFNLGSLVISFIGAIILLAVVNVVQRGQAR